jgi:hypothetical protein
MMKLSNIINWPKHLNLIKLPNSEISQNLYITPNTVILALYFFMIWHLVGLRYDYEDFTIYIYAYSTETLIKIIKICMKSNSIN